MQIPLNFEPLAAVAQPQDPSHQDREEAIAYRVTNGKNAMPAFGVKLGADDIADVAAYVESQSINGWS